MLVIANVTIMLGRLVSTDGIDPYVAQKNWIDNNLDDCICPLSSRMNNKVNLNIKYRCKG